ncbi:MAG: S-layer homology domain-containing protein [Pseudomonadota bacterium]
MQKNVFVESLRVFLFLGLWCFFLTACGLRPEPIERILDTPEHFVSNGLKFIQKGRLDDAEREFKNALHLSPEYSPAHRGIGLVYGLQGRLDKAFAAMEKSKFYAKNPESNALAYVGFMRLHTMRRLEGWLTEVENNFSFATARVKDLPDAYFYLGIALKYSFRFVESRKAFERVKTINSSFLSEAEKELEALETIEAARPVTDAGKAIALLDYITRADAAALFFHELKLPVLVQQPIARGGGRGQGYDMPPIDIENHRFSREIKEILSLDVLELETKKDGRFEPDGPVTRAEYAVMIADILVKIKGDSRLEKRYDEMRSPLRDVRSGAPYFTAVMICTDYSRIMDVRGGFFKPHSKVSGPESLLIIRRLKNNLGMM